MRKKYRKKFFWEGATFLTHTVDKIEVAPRAPLHSPYFDH